MSPSDFWMPSSGVRLDLTFHVWAISEILSQKRPYSLTLSFQCCFLKRLTHPGSLRDTVVGRF